MTPEELKNATAEAEAEKKEETPAAVTEPKTEFPAHAEAVTASRGARYHRGWKTAGIAAGVVLGICGLLCLGGWFFGMHADTFLNHTTINGVDVSGMTAEEAAEALSTGLNENTITLQQDGQKIGTIQPVDLEYDIEGSLDHVLHSSFPEAMKKVYLPSNREADIEIAAPKATKKFNKAFSKLNFHTTQEAKAIETKDAYVDLSSADFKVVKEVYGNQLDPKRVKAALLAAIAKGETEFSFDTKDYYELPAVTADSQAIQDRLDFCKKYLSTVITYKTPLDDVVITPAELDEMLAVNASGKVRVKDEAVAKYVTETLYGKVSTIGMTRTRKSPDGSTYKVSGGSFGVSLDTAGETEQLKKDLAAAKDVTRYPVYNQAPNNSDGTYTDVGNTYVEVCISKQHCWFVKDGSVLIDRDVVTGNVARGNATPPGVYYVYYKTTDATLEDEERTYSTKVKYWMPFNGGMGMHDATYISVFGGSRYLTNGSHGCINMPFELAQTIYMNCYGGMPVIIRP